MHAPVEIRTEQNGDAATVMVAGDIDIATAIAFGRALDDAIERRPAIARVEVDLTDVSFMDSSGLTVLLTARKRASERRLGFSVSRSSPPLVRLFEITGLDSMLTDGRP